MGIHWILFVDGRYVLCRRVQGHYTLSSAELNIHIPKYAPEGVWKPSVAVSGIETVGYGVDQELYTANSEHWILQNEKRHGLKKKASQGRGRMQNKACVIHIESMECGEIYAVTVPRFSFAISPRIRPSLLPRRTNCRNRGALQNYRVPLYLCILIWNSVWLS